MLFVGNSKTSYKNDASASPRRYAAACGHVGGTYAPILASKRSAGNIRDELD
jgi:hypothetical protein